MTLWKFQRASVSIYSLADFLRIANSQEIIFDQKFSPNNSDIFKSLDGFST